MALIAYLDESERENGVFAVAAYLFDEEEARAFDAEWRELLGERLPFHMVDLVAGRKQFEGMARPDLDGLLVSAVQIIKKRVMAGAAVACNVHDFEEVSPGWSKELAHPYSVCAHFCLGLLSHWLKGRGDERCVAYMLEAGHKHSAQANRFFNQAKRHERFRWLYQYDSHAFLLKTDATPLQAADLFVWEWAKYYDETHLKDCRPMRRSLVALTHDRLDDYSFLMLTKQHVRHFYDGWRARADEITIDEAAEFLSQPGIEFDLPEQLASDDDE